MTRIPDFDHRAEREDARIRDLVLEMNRESNALLFAEVRGPMRAGARRALRRVLQRNPDEGDVDEVLYRAFQELLRKMSTESVRDPLALGVTIALRRGLDRARQILGDTHFKADVEREFSLLGAEEPDLDAIAREQRHLALALDCMKMLTPNQRAVIEATIRRNETDSSFALESGVTYQAVQGTRKRALEALRRCVEAKLHGEEPRR